MVYGTPTAGAGNYNASENTPLYGNASLTVPSTQGVLQFAKDPNGMPLTATLVSGPAKGTLVLNADGSFTYTPTQYYCSYDMKSYQSSPTASPIRSATPC